MTLVTVISLVVARGSFFVLCGICVYHREISKTRVFMAIAITMQAFNLPQVICAVDESRL